MRPELFLVIGLLMLLGSLAAVAVSLDFGPSTRRLVRARLGGNPSASAAENSTSTTELVLPRSELGWLRFAARRVAVQQLERNLALAGKSSSWPLSSVVMFKVLTPALLFIPLVLWLSAEPSVIRLGIAIGLLALLYSLPNIVVKGRATERQQAILYELPDVLDQITISVESGLGFEASLARVGQNGKGPLATELARVVQDSRLGMSRRDAYQALAERSEVEDLQRFLKSIVQAEEFGVPISKVVRTQAEELRTKRRQRAEERAAKVALKLLAPMLFCMFPVLFILILTPAVINMGKVL